MPGAAPIGRAITALLAGSGVSVPLTLTHTIEDFDAGVPEDFGLALVTVAFLLSLGYAGQLLGAILSVRRHRLRDARGTDGRLRRGTHQSLGSTSGVATESGLFRRCGDQRGDALCPLRRC